MVFFYCSRGAEEGALPEKLKIPGEYCGPSPCQAAARFIAAIIALFIQFIICTF
jgi:hypothetical protein